MNANELADLLETTESTNNKAATMLRQQQAEIKALKLLLQRCLPIAYCMNAAGEKSPMYANDPTLEESIRAILRKAQES
jgi:hypothetical protein